MNFAKNDGLALLIAVAPGPALSLLARLLALLLDYELSTDAKGCLLMVGLFLSVSSTFMWMMALGNRET